MHSTLQWPKNSGQLGPQGDDIEARRRTDPIGEEVLDEEWDIRAVREQPGSQARTWEDCPGDGQSGAQHSPLFHVPIVAVRI